jgi:hypothetical protein
MNTSSQPIFECCCCFDEETDLNHAVSCDNGHIACTECLERGINCAVGEQTIIKCMKKDCGLEYNEVAIKRAIGSLPKLKNAYDNVLTSTNLRISGVIDVYQCPCCDNAVIINESVTAYQIFYCDSCKKFSCRLCNKERHTGPCNEDRRLEEEETDKFVLKCFCNARMFRFDGCNHLTCPVCRTNWCWICKARLLRPQVEEHYLTGTCKRYGERSEDQVFVPFPENVPRLRKTIEQEGESIKIIGNGFPCSPPIEVTLPEKVIGPVRREKRLKVICSGIKKNNVACTFIARYNNNLYCGHHKNVE